MCLTTEDTEFIVKVTSELKNYMECLEKVRYKIITITVITMLLTPLQSFSISTRMHMHTINADFEMG